jgi:GTP cyclohydrolase II
VAELPSGTVTFLFTDLEVSTRLWEQEPDAMRGALARHDLILRDAVAAHEGHVVKGTGDGIHAAFATADAAVAAAIDAQIALNNEPWAVSEPLRVRTGIHTGVAELRDGDYFGPSVNRAARLMSAAHGGQIVVSLVTEELVRDALPADTELRQLGEHRLRDVGRPEDVFQVCHPRLRADFPPLRSLEHLPGKLPVFLTSFVGRDRELDSVRDALAQARIVTLIGVGGVGKTRLALQVAADAVMRFGRADLHSLEIASEAKVPLQGGLSTRFVVFRDSIGGGSVAVIVGDPDFSKPVPVRLHSACLTGDVFGSRRCDCGNQLQAALRQIAEEGEGVLLYMRQEGRGIGLAAKIHAYKLQEEGLDTVEANARLGFATDLRDYGLGAQILFDLGVRKFRFLTNNPKKVVGLEGYGIQMVEQVPIRTETNPHNAKYLETKKTKMGHLL